MVWAWSLKNKVFGFNETAVAKKIKDFDDSIEKIRTRINEGDVEAVEEMKILTDALVFADGDSEMMVMSSGRSSGLLAARTLKSRCITPICLVLSLTSVTLLVTLLTFSSNLQMAMGATSAEQRKAALAMYGGLWGDLRETWRSHCSCR